MKALRDLGCIVLLLSGLLWLSAANDAPMPQAEEGALHAAQWVMPPFPEALLDQKPAVPFLQQVPYSSGFRVPAHAHNTDRALVQQFGRSNQRQQYGLKGVRQALRREILYPFHAFG